MSPNFRFQLAKISLAILCFFAGVTQAFSQSNKVMGEVRFEGASKVERDSGVWIDGEYIGFLKELKGNKKLLLMPGEHQLEVRQSGYDTFVRKIVVEPGQVQVVRVAMPLSPGARAPDVTATLKLTIQPGRAAVFLDGQYIGHAGELGGAVHSLLISPGKHRIKIELPGYRTFETEVNLLQGQKSEVKTELVKGSIEQAGPDVKAPH
ncbi:MAG TPA: PEGA domain-containing protein [Candidatus Limnocylindrales bacterium]|nr:PEGA domain-containing protein [Candidatus Limnocylindrales bacterium]